MPYFFVPPVGAVNDAGDYVDGFTAKTDQKHVPLADRAIVSTNLYNDPLAGGKRLRAFARIISPHGFGDKLRVKLRGGTDLWRCLVYPPHTPCEHDILTDFGKEQPTVGELLRILAGDPRFIQPLRISHVGVNVETMQYTQLNQLSSKNPRVSMHKALQDLGDELTCDLAEACKVMNDPDLWFPGVDEGIDPVSDDHVQLVMVAWQRELDRELREVDSSARNSSASLPAVPLAQLPWRIQRALTERRRLRFAQWGIGQQEWETNRWSLWNIPEDPEYVSRLETRNDGYWLHANKNPYVY